jgi:hypothetical protein
MSPYRHNAKPEKRHLKGPALLFYHLKNWLYSPDALLAAAILLLAATGAIAKLLQILLD